MKRPEAETDDTASGQQSSEGVSQECSSDQK